MNNNSLKRSNTHTDSFADERPVTRLKPNMPLETAVNVLDDATHTRLDKELLGKLQVRGLPPGMWGAYTLLNFISSNSEGCVDPKYEGTAAMTLVEGNPDLEAELWQAWEAKSFKHIRNLSMCATFITCIRVANPKSRNSSSSTTHSNGYGCGISSARERYISQRLIRPNAHRFLPLATEDSWERTYIGQAADALWMHIARHYEPNNTKVYAHYAAIVQLSGMGKSRTVDELGKQHFSIPMNLRDPKSTGATVYSILSFSSH